MLILSLTEGIITDETRLKVINCLISLTGSLPKRLIEHRIYLTNNIGFGFF